MDSITEKRAGRVQSIFGLAVARVQKLERENQELRAEIKEMERQALWFIDEMEQAQKDSKDWQ